ncbi:hypothetical protein M501DRAFT_1061070 [Patellaria atrata CBS 101060]|uniref:Uncharacterized protein n=1 Tax=Patellaria atrata CBS 101060 TaxID=1346257 RepID=A0A9P4S2W4_9PEZI|nr:hypothetical protein M501DRAFT_1061070 [Patellaria atrata CBS 101060]
MASVQHLEQPASDLILNKPKDLRPESEEFFPNSSMNTPQPNPKAHGTLARDCLELPPILPNPSVPVNGHLQTYFHNFGPTPLYAPMQPSFGHVLPSFPPSHTFLPEFHSVPHPSLGPQMTMGSQLSIPPPFLPSVNTPRHGECCMECCIKQRARVVSLENEVTDLRRSYDDLHSKIHKESRNLEKMAIWSKEVGTWAIFINNLLLPITEDESSEPFRGLEVVSEDTEEQLP